jgi:hypothetical protein
MPISVKKAIEKPKENKPNFTQEQLDMLKYGGDQLF